MNKLISLMVAFSLLVTSTSAHAEDQAPTVPPPLSLNLDLRVTSLTLGDKAPYNGILFTTDAITKMQYDHSLELSLLKNTHVFDLKKFELRLEAEKSLRASEKKMYETILDSRLNRIHKLEDIILSERPDWVLPVAILSSFLVGAGITVGITYAVNQ